MGNRPSKTNGGSSTPRKATELKIRQIEHDFVSSNIDDGPHDDDTPPINILLDPRSPNITRTPLFRFFSHRVTQTPFQAEVNECTPSNVLRKRLLRDIGLNTSKETNLLDPRSPSQFIPRTPLHFAPNDTLDAENSRGSSKVISLEYSGYIEEASCRNFNAKLSNITLDDTDYEDVNDSLVIDGELAEIRRKYMETNFDFVGDEIKFRQEEDPRSPSESICRTPFVLASKAKSLSQSDMSGMENVSPIVTANAIVDDGGVATEKKANIYALFSSTPTVPQTIGTNVVKVKNLEKIIKTRIYEDEPETENAVASSKSIEILTTPLKRFVKPNVNDEKPRTPLSIVNRRSKSAESLAHRHSRLRPVDQENIKCSRPNAQTDENTGHENVTPRRPAFNVNQNHLSARTGSSKIPIFKR